MLYQFTKYFYGVKKNFTSEYKYSLGEDIISLLWKCLDEVIEANSYPNHQKKPKINELSVSYDKVKIRIRMSHDMGLISVRQFAHIEENYMLEIGRMIGGWAEWAENSL